MLRGCVDVYRLPSPCQDADYGIQVGAEIEALKKTIAELEQAVQSARTRQAEAKTECSKLEKDMDEFKNNKEGKINELKVS